MALKRGLGAFSLPWTASDAKDHVKGLSAHQATVWAAVANAALKRCQDGKGDDCDASAIKQANAMAQKAPKTAAEAARWVAQVGDLVEVGRVFSKKNRDAIKAAVDALHALINASDEDAAGEPAAESARVVDASIRTLLEADLSQNDVAAALTAALRGDDASGRRYYWPQDVYPSWFVYQDDGDGSSAGRLLKRTYVIADDGTVTLGEPIEVRRRTVYEPVGTTTAEAADVEVAGDVVPLVEKAVRRDGSVALKLIQPGWGSSGHYSAEMLERDGPKAFKAGLHMYVDHPTAAEEAERPERSVRDIAAVLTSDARWLAEGPAGPGLYADAKVRSDFQKPLEELAPHIGVSIRALGKAKAGEAEGKKGPVIESIVAAKSVDFVTVPGAGGQVLSLFESARGRQSTSATTEESQVTDEEARALREANTAAVGRIAVLEARLIEADARALVTAALASSGLPEVARARLVPQLTASPPLAEAGGLDAAALTARVTEAVAAERAYIASVGGSGQVRGFGASAATEQTAEQREAALLEGFRRLGLPEDAAKLAAAGRT